MCPKFKLMSHDEIVSTLKGNHMCLNCFGRGHGVRQCKSLYKCKKCQKPHHTLLHVDKDIGLSSSVESSDPPTAVSHAAVKLRSSSLLMTCTVLVFVHDGSSVEARALIDNASTSSFVSERLAQSLKLRRSHQNISVSGIAGSVHNSSLQSVAQLQISSAYSRNGRKIDLTESGRFIVPLPRKPDAKPIGESRSRAVRRFLALERSLHHKDRFQEDDSVMEYLDLGHAEIVPIEEMDKDPASVFYLPTHVVYKSSSSTTKIRAVFDASAKSNSGVIPFLLGLPSILHSSTFSSTTFQNYI